MKSCPRTSVCFCSQSGGGASIRPLTYSSSYNHVTEVGDRKVCETHTEGCHAKW